MDLILFCYAIGMWGGGGEVEFYLTYTGHCETKIYGSRTTHFRAGVLNISYIIISDVVKTITYKTKTL